MRVIVVRVGGSVLFGEFGTRRVNVGDVVVLAANTLCGVEPEGWIATTTITYPSNLLFTILFNF